MNPLFWSLVCIALGALVIVIEFVVPSAGMLGVVAGALLVTGIVFGFMAGFQTGALILLFTVSSIPLILVAAIKLWPHTPIGKRILLDDVHSGQPVPPSGLKEMVGRLGVAKTKMLPSGIVLIDGEKFDAVSQGFAIEAGEPVRVVSVKANRIYVEPYDGEVEDVTDLPLRDNDIFSHPLDELGIDPADRS